MSLFHLGFRLIPSIGAIGVQASPLLDGSNSSVGSSIAHGAAFWEITQVKVDLLPAAGLRASPGPLNQICDVDKSLEVDTSQYAKNCFKLCGGGQTGSQCDGLRAGS